MLGLSRLALGAVLALFGSLGGALIGVPASAQDCAYAPWLEFKGDTMYRHNLSDTYYYITTDLRIDTDGAPNAFAPQDSGLDLNETVGYPQTLFWQNFLEPDPQNPQEPYLQRFGAFAGHFVSKTALFDPRLDPIDPERYVDATRIPYIVFPSSYEPIDGTGRLGDYGIAINLESGKTSPFIVGDRAPEYATLGEISLRLAEELAGRSVDPRTGEGAPSGEIMYVVFRFSSDDDIATRWRRSLHQIVQEVKKNLALIGGLDPALACLTSPAPQSQSGVFKNASSN